MSSGLLALLDDVAAIFKAASASIDDVAAQTVKASGKAAGIVIDDAAVTPKYVIGLSASREIPIVWNISKGSIRNKLLLLMPGLLLLGYMAPWSIQWLLAVGGLFLCYEGVEKILHAFRHHRHSEDPNSADVIAITPEELEKTRTAGAIRTDFILSAEIMAIAYYEVRDMSFVRQVIVLTVVAVLITVAVYGFVALILKADDWGLHLVKTGKSSGTRRFGKGVVRSMPNLLKVLSVVGTAAMLWVGGGILLHAYKPFAHAIEEWIQSLQLSGAGTWGVGAVLGLIVGVIAGAVIVSLIGVAQKLAKKQ
jgi:predicted DNA repair protein MutK